MFTYAGNHPYWQLTTCFALVGTLNSPRSPLAKVRITYTRYPMPNIC